MKSSELRIGNYVDYGNGREPQKITGHDLYEGVEGRPFRPIPLTEEWLFKFGFWKKSEESNMWKIPQSNYRWCIHKTGMKNPFDFRSSDNFLYFLKTLEYVHQLQNLYFALTGEELELKDAQQP